jgi:hypothetical protein
MEAGEKEPRSMWMRGSGACFEGGRLWKHVSVRACVLGCFLACTRVRTCVLVREFRWGKFPDGTDNIEVGGFTPFNVIAGERVLFLASFHNNDVTLSQFQVRRAPSTLARLSWVRRRKSHIPRSTSRLLSLSSQVLVMLLQSFIKELVVVLPFYPVSLLSL